MAAIASVFIVLILSLIIGRIATVALTATGMTRESARFQARSALTGVGYTTSEAEQVVNHPLRRRIVMVLMLIGNAGLVTIIASMMLSFAGAQGARGALIRVGILVGGLLVLFFIARNDRVDAWMSRHIARYLARYTDVPIRDYARLMQLTREYGISEMVVEPDDWMTGRTLAELKLRDEGIVVLGINRRGDGYMGAPHGDTELRPGDELILYGRTAVLSDLDDRRRDEGDAAHAQAVAEQRRLEREEQGRAAS